MFKTDEDARPKSGEGGGKPIVGGGKGYRVVENVDIFI